MYQEPNTLDADNFANFTFAQPAGDIDQTLPLPENLLQPPPPNDLRAATGLMNATHQLMDDLQKLMEQLTVVHNLLYRPLNPFLSHFASSPLLPLVRVLMAEHPKDSQHQK